MIEQLRILGKTYQIVRTEHVDGLSAGEYFGSCDHTRSILTINARQEIQQERDTVLHEVLHAIDYTMQLGLKERQVHALGSGLLAVLTDNPELAFYLAGHLVEVVDEKPATKKTQRRRKAT